MASSQPTNSNFKPSFGSRFSRMSYSKSKFLAVFIIAVAVGGAGFYLTGVSMARPETGCMSRVLSYGQRNECVRVVQRTLGVNQTGFYGPQTKAAVSNYQRYRGIRPITGNVGPKTWANMCARGMERWACR